MHLGALTLAIVVCAVPLAVEAQSTGKIWQVGLLHVGLDHIPPSLEGLREGLRALGYEEGKNIRLDWRNLPDEAAARATANEFVRNRVDLMIAFENQTIRAAKAATSEIPVVFLHTSDPVADGFVKSWARPGGNLTGFAGIGNVPDKEVELFTEIVPQLRRLLVLVDPEDPATRRWLAKVRQAGAVLKLNLIEREVKRQADVERVFGSLKRSDVDGVFMASPDLRVKFSALTLRLATERRLPVAGHRKEWVAQGALFSYADNVRAIGRAAAGRYVDKLLKGARPEDLPVEEITEFELVINVKTATALGLTIPRSVLLRADHVIQ